MAKHNDTRPLPTRHLEPAMGAGDSNSGGGNAGGSPDAETAMRIGDPARNADVKADRAKLFPGQADPRAVTEPDGGDGHA